MASPGTAALSVVLVTMKAHGEACGFTSCEGVAATALFLLVPASAFADEPPRGSVAAPVTGEYFSDCQVARGSRFLGEA